MTGRLAEVPTNHKSHDPSALRHECWDSRSVGHQLRTPGSPREHREASGEQRSGS